MADNLEYFIESIGNSKSFNLWVKQAGRYFNRATLFFQDESCGTQWDISDLEHSVSYNEAEIADETENPLRKIENTDGDLLLQMKGKSPQEVFDYISQLNSRGIQNAKSL